MDNPINLNNQLDQAIQLDKQGNALQALAIIEKILPKIQPAPKLDTLIHSAKIAERAGRPAKAAEWFRLAWTMQPSNTLRKSYLVNLMESGNLIDAENEARLAIKKSQKESDFWNILGVILKRQNRLDEAIKTFAQAAKLNPRLVSPWINLGNSHVALHEYGKALEAFNKAVKIEPNNVENLRLLATAYKSLGEYDKAFKILASAHKIAPRNLKVWAEVIATYFNSGRYQSALDETEELLKLVPDNLDHQRNRGLILKKLGRIEDAVVVYRGLLNQNPDDIDTVIALGNIYYYELNDRKAANEVYEKAYKTAPGNTALASAYCRSLSNSRYGDESAHFAKAYDIARKLASGTDSLLAAADDLQGVFLRTVDYENIKKLGEKSRLLNYWLNTMNVWALHNQLGRVESLEDRIELVKVHAQWGAKIQANADQFPITRGPFLPKRKKVRIGLMSSDLRHHPVTYFVQPILEKYDRSRFEVYCYSFYPGEPDNVQKRISEIVDRFAVYAKLGDRQIAQHIADDELDILFELGGTTLLNKVQVCAYRPAPVQVSWLGYPHSAGLPSIDYLLVDPYTRPSQDNLMLEKPFLMPESWVSLGDLGFNDSPIEPTLPQQRNGFITFGTANNPYKYTPACIAAWASAMRQVEDSRFLFLRPEGGIQAFRENICQHFQQHGISSDRILFIPVRGNHLQYYNSIDIALDPFPHVGGTTTCESLWMGVPVVTLVGPAVYERLSYSNLSNAGLSDLCAHSLEEYVKIAVTLAEDKQRREMLRFNLRAQIRANPLGQTERFVRNFEAQVINVLDQHRGANQ